MKPNSLSNRRYFLDPLYGVIHFPDFVWKVIYTPEIQRLRELRLYNINSLYFTGGANINRFEHSIGTCYLALQFVEFNKKQIPEKERVLFVLAALFHDLYNAAFGHTIEYNEEGFSPEEIFYYAVTDKIFESYNIKDTYLESIYFGMPGELLTRLTKDLKLDDSDIFKIGKIIRGKGKYGSIISGSIDLDNIDNVYRMSYHMGLINKTDVPLKIVKSFTLNNEKLMYKPSSIGLLKQWIELRERLYKFLLLNPDEFSAKYMLTEAIELSKKQKSKSFSWYDTDFQVLEQLSKSSENVKKLISRLMKGDYYGCFGLYKTTRTDKYVELSDVKQRLLLEDKLNGLFKPEIKKQVSNFSSECQNAIKGLIGISFNDETKILTLNLKLNEKRVNSLTSNVLMDHKRTIDNMFKELNDKYDAYKLKSPLFGIHTLTDINKVNRKVTVYLPPNEELNLGFSSNNLYIGIFIKNREFANFNIYNNSLLNLDNIKNIKNKLYNFLVNFLEDPELKEVALYSEIRYGK